MSSDRYRCWKAIGLPRRIQHYKMESSLPIDHQVPRGQLQHHHVPKLFSLPDTTPKEVDSQIQQQPCDQQMPKSIIQLVRPGEGKDISNLSNFVSQNDKDRTKWKFSLHRPILVRDTPESIGMEIPKGRSRKRKRTMSTSKVNGNDNNDEGKDDFTAFSVRDVADAVGHSSPVQVIDVLSQEFDKDLDDWTFLDLVEYFEDEERLLRSKPSLDTSPLPVSPTTGRSRRKAAIQSEKCFAAMIHQEKSTGEASKRILNQISYEFSGTPLHSMVRSPKIVRDIDWIDQAWPAKRKPRKSETKIHHKELDQNNTNMQKKASKGKNSYEYPGVQYYCLTSSAGSYTDFHIDFGGSSVWYHVVRGEKIFVISPPTPQNLKVYEEWLCHPDQAKTFLPDLMKERACPDIHRYSRGDVFCSTSSVSTNSSASTYASSASLGDLADEMAFFRNSLNNTLSTNNSLRFTLKAGETLLLPAGWIHAVYTPVDSLVFGGNFLHGLDINLQLRVNGIEARSGVLDQYRFPHFGALQMYAGGMYLKRLKAMGKSEKTRKEENETCDSISPRELEELPMLMNALEFWWITKNDEENGEKIANARNSRNFDSITSQASFRDAALYVTKENGCDSVEEFIATFRNEYARIASKQWGSYRVSPSNDPIGQFTSLSTLPVPLSSIPIAIGKPKKNPKTNKKSKPRHKRNRKGTTEMDDPLDVVLSKDVKEFLASIQITTAAQLLLAKTTDVAKDFPKWRKEKGMSELKGKAGAQASVSVWKRKVRLRAAMVGATKLAQINVGTNTKKIELNDGQSLELNETRKESLINGNSK